MTLQEFRELADLALRATRKLLEVSQDPPMIDVKDQLETVLSSIEKKQASSNLAKNLTMGQIIVYSYMPAPTADIDRWGKLILLINHTYKKWSDNNG